jgi:sarcosine/dimethylglycine N-methyltransferase
MSTSVSRDDIRKNYSQVGTNLIEQLYGDDFLSLSGAESSDAMIAAAGIGPETRVLDVGCGVGGPALYLAEKTGCHIIGVDLMEWHAEEAASRAAERGLSGRTEFQAGDATALAFPDVSFDVVWSQDAWCHAPDKPMVIAEAARVVKPGGHIVFTDWVALGDMEPDYLAAIQSAVSAPNFATPEEYRGWLEAQGCTVLHFEDISARFAARYRTMIANLNALEDQVSAQFSPRVFTIMQEKNTMILRAFEDGKVGGLQLAARKG